MPDALPYLAINNSKKYKYLKREDSLAVEILVLALQSNTAIGEALRALIRRARRPDAPLTDRDLEILLLLGLAEIEAGLKL